MRAAPAWGDPRHADWEAVSEDGELICPDCLAVSDRHGIDGEAMEMAAEVLGSYAHARPRGAFYDVLEE
jgi:hypothetical protein